MHAATFMLSVLASELFWVGYGLFSLVMATMILRSCEGTAWVIEMIKDQKEWDKTNWGDRAAGILLIFCGTMLVWPIVTLVLFIKWTAMAFMLLLRLIIIGADKMVPNVSVKLKK